MFAVNLMLASGQWKLLFTDEEKARAAFTAFVNQVTPDFTAIVDDFGQELRIDPRTVKAVLFEDMNKTKLAAVELHLHQARTQQAMMKAAQGDPGLRANAALNGGFPIMSNMPQGRPL